MRTVYADFNARIDSDRVDLRTRGSQDSLARSGVGIGDWVWLSDGEIRVEARIESLEGGLVGRVVWATREDVVENAPR